MTSTLSGHAWEKKRRKTNEGVVLLVADLHANNDMKKASLSSVRSVPSLSCMLHKIPGKAHLQKLTDPESNVYGD